jgi:hypothetical protein
VTTSGTPNMILTIRTNCASSNSADWQNVRRLTPSSQVDRRDDSRFKQDVIGDVLRLYLGKTVKT